MVGYSKYAEFIVGFLIWALGVGILIPGAVLLSIRPHCEDKSSNDTGSVQVSPPLPPGPPPLPPLVPYSERGRQMMNIHYNHLRNQRRNSESDCRTGPIIMIIIGGIVNIIGGMLAVGSGCSIWSARKIQKRQLPALFSSSPSSPHHVARM